MTAMPALVGSSIEPFFAIPIPPGLDPVARSWIAAHAHQGVMVLLPGEAMFADDRQADDFASHLGAVWAVTDTE
jgi:hypothetical protein